LFAHEEQQGMTTGNTHICIQREGSLLSARGEPGPVSTLQLSVLVGRCYLEEVQKGLKKAAPASAGAARSGPAGGVRITPCYLHSSVAMISALLPGFPAKKFKIFPHAAQRHFVIPHLPGASPLRALSGVLLGSCHGEIPTLLRSVTVYG
jgi:hypothetical protein